MCDLSDFQTEKIVGLQMVRTSVTKIAELRGTVSKILLVFQKPR